MLTGIYSGVSAQHYNGQKLGVISNNLANAETTGFRRSMMIVKSRDENSYSRWIDPEVKKRLPKDHGVQRTGIYKNYNAPGDLQLTKNPFDVAIPTELKNAFFSVKGQGADDKSAYYTRNGTLSLGLLNPADQNSPSVLHIGGHIALDEGKQPIQVDPLNGPIKITSGGILQQDGVDVSEIPIYRLNKKADPNNQASANLQGLEQRGNSLFAVPEGKEKEFNPFRLRVGVNGVHRLVLQGMKEGSNVNLFQELVEMMNVTKSSSANKKAISIQSDGLSKLFQLVRR